MQPSFSFTLYRHFYHIFTISELLFISHLLFLPPNCSSYIFLVW